MASTWYIRGGGKLYGPLDSAKLKQLAATGKIDQTTEVAQNPGGPWHPAGKVRGLFVQPPIEESASPPPSPPPRARPVPAAPVARPVTAAPADPPAAPSPLPYPAKKRPPPRQGSYVDANLLPGESVEYRGHLHWLYFLRPVMYFTLAYVMFRMSGQKDTVQPDGQVGFMVIGTLLVITGIFSTVIRLIISKTSEFAVTNRRVIMKQGFIRRRTLELMLGKVDSLSVEQGILGRIFGYGSVRVTVATEKQRFDFLANPLEFRRQVQMHTPT